MCYNNILKSFVITLFKIFYLFLINTFVRKRVKLIIKLLKLYKYMVYIEQLICKLKKNNLILFDFCTKI